MAAPTTSFSGIASGIDSATLIANLVKLERQPIDQMQQAQTDLKSQSKRLGDIKNQLNSLRTAAVALREPANVLQSTATSSLESAVKVTSSTGAAIARYRVAVNSLAHEERDYSAGFASKTDTGLVSAGSFDITIGTTTTTITVDGSESLQGIADKINASGADVKASIVFDGSQYHVALAGKNLGASNGFTVTEAGTNLAFTENQAATDAVITVDGFTMHRTTNTITDALDGVTLELKSETTTDATVSVEQNAAAVEGLVKAFVDAYNKVNDTIDNESRYTGKARIGDSLSGDPTLRALQARLRSEATSPLTSGVFRTLGSIGVAPDRTGRLVIDQTKLHAALTTDPQNAATFIAGTGTNADDGVVDHFIKAADDYTKTTTSALSARISSIDSRVRSYDTRMATMQLRLDKYEENLRAQFTRLEQTMAGMQVQSNQLAALAAG